MAERKLSGDDYLLFIDPAGGASYELIVCLTEQQFNRATTEIDAKSKCGPDKLPGTQTIELTFSGQVMLDPSGSTLSEADLHGLWSSSSTIGWKLGVASPTIGDVSYSGTGFISKLDSSYGMDNPATFSGSIGVYGTATQTIED